MFSAYTAASSVVSSQQKGSPMLSMLRRALRRWTCDHDFQPFEEEQDEALGDGYLVVTERCAHCGATRQQTTRITGYGLVLLLLLLPALAGAKDLAIESGGRDAQGVLHANYPALDYTRPVDLDAAARAISAQLAASIAANPSRKLLVMCMGMSIAQMACQRLDQLLSVFKTADEGFRDLKRPGARVIRCPWGGKTAKEWADPADPAWAECRDRIPFFVPGATVDDVVMGVILMTQAFPDTNGVMTQAQVQAVGTNFRANFPQAPFLVTTTIDWTGQGGSINARAPVWSVHGDQQVLASTAGVHANGLFIDFLTSYADGNVPNPHTASSKNPAITWGPADTASDGVHLVNDGTVGTRVGADKMARSLLGRWLDDPIYWFLWAGKQAPEVGGGGGGPVSVPLSGTLTKDGASCTFTAGQGTVSLPASWCAGL